MNQLYSINLKAALLSLCTALGLLLHFNVQANTLCEQNKVRLQVLGSGGPEINDQRASSGYLIWVNDKAQLLIDAGSGSSFNFERSGAQFKDLKAILLSHLHVDHSADLPTFIKGSFFSDRRQDLTVYGPEGNNVMPSTTAFIERLFGKQGAFRYLSDYLDEKSDAAYHLDAVNLPLMTDEVQSIALEHNIRLSAVSVHHGPLPALAWRVDVFDCSVTFSGDMNNDFQHLAKLAADTDVLLMHNAVAESAQGVAANLHMKPSIIGEIAQSAQAKKVIISHRMLRTLGREEQTLAAIREAYSQPVFFANDLSSFPIFP